MAMTKRLLLISAVPYATWEPRRAGKFAELCEIAAAERGNDGLGGDSGLDVGGQP